MITIIDIEKAVGGKFTSGEVSWKCASREERIAQIFLQCASILDLFLAWISRGFYRNWQSHRIEAVILRQIVTMNLDKTNQDFTDKGRCTVDQAHWLAALALIVFKEERVPDPATLADAYITILLGEY